MHGFTRQPDRDDVFRMPTMTCPSCGYVCDAVSDVDDKRDAPKHDDWLVCLNCAQPSALVIGALGMSLRDMTPDELAEYAVDRYDLSRTMREFVAATWPERADD